MMPQHNKTEQIDKEILSHLQHNKRGLKRTLYHAVESKNRNIRREAIGRRINELERDGVIYVIRVIGGEELYGMSE